MRGRVLASCLMIAMAMSAGASAVAAMEPEVSAAQAEAGEGPPAVEVAVTRDGEVWTAYYVFAKDAPVWGFIRSSFINGTRDAWRPGDWSVVTPGVVLERVGDLDVFRAIDGGDVPRRVSLRLTPRDHNLEADYGVLIFTDGSTAMFTGAFDVFPLPSLEAARAAPEDLNGFVVDKSNARITWRDAGGPVLLHGKRLGEAVTEDGATYVLFGEAQMKEGERLVTVVDPELPAWVAATIEDFGPRVAEYYTGRMGPGQSDRPTVVASWKGPTPGLQSMGGSVLPGLIVMNFEGIGQVSRSPDSEAATRWFIGHESAHFWLGQTVRYERSRDSWITEGGADLMAIRALKALYPDYDARTELQREVDDCVRLAVKPVREAVSRGEYRAFYACGSVFALTAEGAQRRAAGGDWFDFLQPLIDASREDGVLTREEWLAELTRVSGDASLRADIETLLDDGSADPAALIAGLFDRTGVGYRRQDGKVALN
ncbi:hypothetical protein [Brevundimonas sp.]|uniref:hypothetical protein n=1 Tax=Brevundimonas sp. TaxID=1871086 RepID=UPI002BACC3C0|nr:hypothetical protein [Brevundimonas sp.]HWQ88065.1 hypothetical protein [Brevundimonas sp.]